MSLAGLVLLVVSLLAQAPRPDPTPADPTDRDPFVLGILRRDGIVSPFAAFDGKTWKAPWPMDLLYVDLPISIDAIPKAWWGKTGLPTGMTVWADGAARGTIALTRLTTIRIMCSSRLALTSTYRSPEPAPPPMVQPYPKDGLVISNGQRIRPIETLSRTSDEWVPTAVMLVEPFDSVEIDAIRAFTDWKHPMSREERRKVPVELETMYRAPMDIAGWTAYHVEAVKHYPPGPADDACGLVTYVSGWMLSGPDGRRRLQLGAEVTYCDRRGNTYMLPLGLIENSGRSYWVYQVSGYEREGYAVVRPTPGLNEAQVTYTAGQCLR